MFKRLSILIISLNFILVSCSNDNNNNNNDDVQEKDQIKITTSYKENIDDSKKIIFSGKTFTQTKYVTLGNLLFFPDLDNNNKLSVATLPKTSGIIDSNLIIDSFDFNLISLVSDENSIYFSSTSPEKGFYKLNYEKREITKLNSHSPINLIYANERVYYVNSTDNKLYYYNITDNKTYLLSNSLIKNFILNNNSIFYINYNDGSKLYCLKIDGSCNFNITDSAVESFVIYNDKILFSNSNDNNYIYSLDINNFHVNKVLNLSTSSFKQNSNNTYFIINEDPNYIYKFLLDKEDSKYEYTKVFSNSANQYFVTDLGIFIEVANDLESIYFIKEN